MMNRCLWPGWGISMPASSLQARLRYESAKRCWRPMGACAQRSCPVAYQSRRQLSQSLEAKEHITLNEPWKRVLGPMATSFDPTTTEKGWNKCWTDSLADNASSLDERGNPR